MSRDRGQLAIVLHTHMPYVEGFGTWPFGEEWLWLSVAESYLRLEPVLARFPVTIGITPVLADQFERMGPASDGDAGERMLAFFAGSREYVFGQDMGAFVGVGESALADALEPQLADYRGAAARFAELGGDLNSLFASFARNGAAELLAGPATHPIVPLLATDFGVDLQLRVGIESHRRRFAGDAAGNGSEPGAPSSGSFACGIWLPECAYTPGVERHLVRNGVSHFCVDQSAVYGIDSPANLEPVRLPGDVVAAPIDWQTVERVWSEGGYPSAREYRSSFKRSVHGLMPWDNAGRVYARDRARERARRDAEDFLAHVRARLDGFRRGRGSRGLCVFAVDTELLGHWWYEGPWWLEFVCEGAAAAGVEIVTLRDGLATADAVERELRRSSWGENKDLSTWDAPEVADFAWQTRAAELELFDALGHEVSASGVRSASLAGVAAAGASQRGRAGGDPSGERTPTALPHERAAVHAARELLALQGSDWAFMAKRRTAGDYAHKRFARHLAAFRRAIGAVSQSTGADGVAEHGRPAIDAPAAEPSGLAPGLTPQRLAEIRCAY